MIKECRSVIGSLKLRERSFPQSVVSSSNDVKYAKKKKSDSREERIEAIGERNQDSLKMKCNDSKCLSQESPREEWSESRTNISSVI